MKHPTACSFFHEGVEVEADKNGVFDMPDELVAAATEFGFEQVTGKGKADKADASAD